MSDELTTFIEQLVVQFAPPPDHALTDEVREQFYGAMDKANEYRGEPSVLLDALYVLQRTPSTPLFYAGIAYVHLHGAYIQGFTYSKAGLNAAQNWLQHAQLGTANISELLLVKAFLAIRTGMHQEAEQILAHLQATIPDRFHFLIAQMEYEYLRSMANMAAAYQKALAKATSNSQRAYAHGRAARYYSARADNRGALRVYQELVALTPDDPWAWHNMSVIYYGRWNMPKAWACNKRALQIMEFENARRMQKSIRLRSFQLPVIAIILLTAVVVKILGALGY